MLLFCSLLLSAAACFLLLLWRAYIWCHDFTLNWPREVFMLAGRERRAKKAKKWGGEVGAWEKSDARVFLSPQKQLRATQTL